MEDFLKISFSLTPQIADVTANTNGLKTAEKQEDGSFAFSERTTGSYSGLKDTTADSGI